MKRSLIDLMGFSIETIDGPKGKVKDFLFDEDSWVIRYLDADFGNFFKDKRVLIPGIFMNQPDWDKKRFPIELNKETIESCPAPEDVMTVSREYEELLSQHYDYYWPWAYTMPPGAEVFPTRPLTIPETEIDEKNLDSSLRSFKEIKGYNINTIDGKLGHIEDIIVDDADWQILYIITDTSNWLPWSRKVILPIDKLREISYVRNEITVDLHTDTIKHAPEFDHEKTFAEEDEQALTEYYSRSMSNVR